MYQSYEDACEAVITKIKAKAIIEDHGLSFDDFEKEVGPKSIYSGKEVLDWLQY